MAGKPGEPQLSFARQHGDLLLYFGHMMRGRILVADPAVLKDMLVTRPDVFDKPENTVRDCRRRRPCWPLVLRCAVVWCDGMLPNYHRKSW